MLKTFRSRAVSADPRRFYPRVMRAFAALMLVIGFVWAQVAAGAAEKTVTQTGVTQPVVARLDAWEAAVPEPVAAEIARLRQGDVEQKTQAAKQLAEMGPKALGAVKAIIENWDWTYEVPHERLAMTLRAHALRDMRSAFASALAAIGEEAVEPILHAMADKPSIAVALARIRDPNAVDALAAALQSAEPARSPAAEALWSLGTPEAVTALLSEIALEGVGTQAAKGTRHKLESPAAIPVLVTVLLPRTDDVLVTAARGLGHLIPASGAVRSEVLPPLVGLLDYASADVYREVWDALAKIDPTWADSEAAANAVPALARSLARDDAAVRARVLAVLGRIGDARVAGRIMAMLSDPEPHVRSAAASALKSYKGPETVKALLNAFDHEQDVQARVALISSLSATGDVAALPALIRAAQHNSAVRSAAISALGGLEGHEAVETLIVIAGAGPDSGYTAADIEHTARALSWATYQSPVERERARQALLGLTSDDHWTEATPTRRAGRLRRTAETALRQLTDRED